MGVSKRRFRELEKSVANLEKKIKNQPTDEIAKGVADAVIKEINRGTTNTGKNALII